MKPGVTAATSDSPPLKRTQKENLLTEKLDVEALSKSCESIGIRMVRRTGVPERDAEDVYRDAVLAALIGASGFNGMSQPKTWFLGIVKNKAKDYLRAAREAPCGEIHESSYEPYDNLDAALDAPDEVVLFGMGYTYEEIGEVLDVSWQTVKAKISVFRKSERATRRD